MVKFDLEQYLARQIVFSTRAFGPHDRRKGVIDHMRKELLEVEQDPDDLEEWIDLVMLAFDGAWRSGYTPREICLELGVKLAKNENRDWPDWRELPVDKAIEHKR